jgi:hypothetical protein
MVDKHRRRELSLLTAFYKNQSHDFNSSLLAPNQLNPNQLDVECNMCEHGACMRLFMRSSQDAQVSKRCIQATTSALMFTYSSIVCKSVYVLYQIIIY